MRNDYDRDVFNGDIGFIVGPLRDELGELAGLVVDFDGRRVEYDVDALGALELAYAVSIHKSQGSEYPAVVIPLVSAHHMMLRRKLLYTAITRARALAVLVVEPNALRRAVASADDADRETGLCACDVEQSGARPMGEAVGDDQRDGRAGYDDDHDGRKQISEINLGRHRRRLHLGALAFRPMEESVTTMTQR